MTTENSPPPNPTREARFRDLWALAHADVVRFVARRSDPVTADDVAAEVFLTAWRRLDDVPADPSAARAWLYGTARHLLLNAIRGDRRRDALAVRVADAAPISSTGEDDLATLRADLAAAWPRLTATDQEALAMVTWEGLSAPEAARVLDISPVAFRLRLSRARRALKVHLDLVNRTAPGLTLTARSTT